MAPCDELSRKYPWPSTLPQYYTYMGLQVELEYEKTYGEWTGDIEFICLR